MAGRRSRRSLTNTYYAHVFVLFLGVPETLVCGREERSGIMPACVVTTSAKRGKLAFCGFVCVTSAYSELILHSGTTAASAILCSVGLCTFCERQQKFCEAAPVFQKGRQVVRLASYSQHPTRGDSLFTSPLMSQRLRHHPPSLP